MDELTARLINERLGRPAPEQSLPEAALRGAGAALSLGYLSNPAAATQHPVAYWLGQLAGSSPYWALGAEALQGLPYLRALAEAGHPAISRLLTAGALGGGFGSVEEAGRELGAGEPLSPGRIAESGAINAPLAALGEAGLLGIRRLFKGPLPIPAPAAAQAAQAAETTQGGAQAATGGTGERVPPPPFSPFGATPTPPGIPSVTPVDIPLYPGEVIAQRVRERIKTEVPLTVQSYTNDLLNAHLNGEKLDKLAPLADLGPNTQKIHQNLSSWVVNALKNETEAWLGLGKAAKVGKTPKKGGGGPATPPHEPPPSSPSPTPAPVTAQSASAEPAPEVRPAAAPTGGQAGAGTQGGPHQPGIKFIITAADRAALRALDYSAEDISRMRPEEAGTILAQGLHKGPTQAGAVPPKPGGPSALNWLRLHRFPHDQEIDSWLTAYTAKGGADSYKDIVAAAPKGIKERIEATTAELEPAATFNTLGNWFYNALGKGSRQFARPDSAESFRQAVLDAVAKGHDRSGSQWETDIAALERVAAAPQGAVYEPYRQFAERMVPVLRDLRTQQVIGHGSAKVQAMTTRMKVAAQQKQTGVDIAQATKQGRTFFTLWVQQDRVGRSRSYERLLDSVTGGTGSKAQWTAAIDSAIEAARETDYTALAESLAKQSPVTKPTVEGLSTGAVAPEQNINELATELKENGQPLITELQTLKKQITALKEAPPEPTETPAGEEPPPSFEASDTSDMPLFDIKGRIALPLVSALARGGIGAGVGGVLGATSADNPEDRLKRAIIGAGVGGIAGAAFQSLTGRIPPVPPSLYASSSLQAREGILGRLSRLLGSERGAVGGPPLVPPFYSHLRRVVDEKMPDKVSVEQLIGPPAGMRKKTPSGEEIKGGWLRAQGVKEDEMAHTGLLNWLEGKRGEKVAKSAVQDFLDINAVQVESTVYGQHSAPEHKLGGVDRWQQVAPDRWRDRWNPELFITQGPHGGYELSRVDLHGREWGEGRGNDFAEAAFAARDFQDMAPGDQGYRSLKYDERYRLPGAKNYREEALSLASQPEDKSFGGGHFVPNEVANMRFSDRDTTVGDKALFVEEFQGDWGVDARKYGIQGSPELEARWQAADDRWRQLLWERNHMVQHYGMNLDEAYAYVQQSQPGTPGRGIVPELPSAVMEALRIRNDLFAADNRINEAYNIRRRLEKRQEKAVPPAPFVPQGWLSLALKKLLHRAVTEGKDTLAWPFGEVIANRYHTKIVNKDWPMKLYDQMVPIELKKLLGKEVNIETREIVTEPGKDVLLDGIGFSVPAPNSDMWTLTFVPLRSDTGGAEWSMQVRDRQLHQWLGQRGAEHLRALGQEAAELYPQRPSSGIPFSSRYMGTPGLHVRRPDTIQKVHAVNLAPSVQRRIKDQGFSLFTVPLAVGAAGAAAYSLAPQKKALTVEQAREPAQALQAIHEDQSLDF